MLHISILFDVLGIWFVGVTAMFGSALKLFCRYKLLKEARAKGASQQQKQNRP